jgi:hypothetical protein
VGETYTASTAYTIEYSTDGGTNWQTYTGPIAVTASLGLQARVRKSGTSGSRTQYAYVTSDAAQAAQAQFDFISADWLAEYFGAGYQTNANAASYADPDGDGLSNVMEYLLGTDPTDRQFLPGDHD